MSKDIDKLMSAVKDGNLDKVKSMLDGGFFRRKVNVNAADNGGWTALMWASWGGHLGVMTVLLDRGADVNAANNGGGIALMIASRHGRAAIVTALCDRGAAVNAADHDGWTALMHASLKGHVGVVTALCARGAAVNAANHLGSTALIIASRYGHADVVTALCDRGADVDAVDSNGNTAITLAHDEAIVKILRECRGTRSAPVIASRNIPYGSTNSILFQNINEGNLMVNIPRNNATTNFQHETYYKNTPEIRGLRKHPLTRRVLKPSNFRPYRAHIIGHNASAAQVGVPATQVAQQHMLSPSGAAAISRAAEPDIETLVASPATQTVQRHVLSPAGAAAISRSRTPQPGGRRSRRFRNKKLRRKSQKSRR